MAKSLLNRSYYDSSSLANRWIRPQARRYTSNYVLCPHSTSSCSAAFSRISGVPLYISTQPVILTGLPSIADSIGDLFIADAGQPFLRVEPRSKPSRKESETFGPMLRTAVVCSGSYGKAVCSQIEHTQQYVIVRIDWQRRRKLQRRGSTVSNLRFKTCDGS